MSVYLVLNLNCRQDTWSTCAHVSLWNKWNMRYCPWLSLCEKGVIYCFPWANCGISLVDERYSLLNISEHCCCQIMSRVLIPLLLPKSYKSTAQRCLRPLDLDEVQSTNEHQMVALHEILSIPCVHLLHTEEISVGHLSTLPLLHCCKK